MELHCSQPIRIEWFFHVYYKKSNRTTSCAVKDLHYLWCLKIFLNCTHPKELWGWCNFERGFRCEYVVSMASDQLINPSLETWKHWSVGLSDLPGFSCLFYNHPFYSYNYNLRSCRVDKLTFHILKQILLTDSPGFPQNFLYWTETWRTTRRPW